MESNLDPAIEELRNKLKTQMEDVIETKKAINLLRKIKGDSPLFNDLGLNQVPDDIRPDQYYGKPLSTAAREYLEYKKEACTAKNILQGLQEGGFDFDALGWSESDRLRIFSISLGKNSATFHRLPNGTYGLLAWYPNVKKAKTDTNKDKKPFVPTQLEQTERKEEEQINTDSEEKYESNTESDQ